MNKIAEQYRAAVYVRLSKEDMLALSGKKAESDSIFNQKEYIFDWIKNKTDIQIVSVRVDDGYTGTNFDRPSFQMMMEDIKSGKINCVIVKDLSRFGREYINAGKYIDRLFPFYGVRLIAINDGIDTITKDPSDNLNITLKNLINDNYCRDISMKIRSHLEIKRKNGEYTGSFAPYGYRKSEEDHNRLEIDEYAASVVQDIFHWKLEGISADHIAKRLIEQGVPSPMEYKRSQGENFKTGFETGKKISWTPVAVRRILTNPVYIGTLIQGIRTRPNYKIKTVVVNDEEKWSKVENNHDPIVSKKTFNLVQRLLLLDTRTSPSQAKVFPLAGLVVCGDCESPMVRITVPCGEKKYYYYVCDGNRKKQGCSSHRISEKILLDSVLAVLQEHIHLIFQMEACLKDIQNTPLQKIHTKKLQERMQRVEEEMDRYRRLKISLYEDMQDGLISKDDYKDIRDQYDQRIREAQTAHTQLQKELDMDLNSQSKPHEWIEEFLEHQDLQELNRIVAVQCIEQVRVYEGKKLEVIFAHSQDFNNLMEQIQLYQNEFNAEVV